MLKSHLVTGLGLEPWTRFPEWRSWQYAFSECFYADPQVHIRRKGAFIPWAFGVNFDFLNEDLL